MTQNKKWLLLIGLMAVMTACSPSKRVQDGEDGDITEELSGDESTQASTDAVPSENNPEQAAAKPEEKDPLAELDEKKDAAPVVAEKAKEEKKDVAEPIAPPPVAEAPAPAPAPVSAPAADTPSFASNGESESYTVQKGDTLMKIAFETSGNLYDWKKIWDMNKDKVSDPNKLPVGASIKVAKAGSSVAVEKNGDKYLIKKGDTLGTISREVYGTPKKWKKIYENNRSLIKDPNKIYAGFTLYYTMTPEDQEEMKHFKDQPVTAPAPLSAAPAPAAPARAPASAAPVAPAPAVKH